MFFFKNKKRTIDSKIINDVIESADKLYNEYNKPIEPIESEDSNGEDCCKYQENDIENGNKTDNALNEPTFTDSLKKNIDNTETIESSEHSEKYKRDDGIKYSLKDNAPYEFDFGLDEQQKQIEEFYKKWKALETFSDKIERFIQSKNLTSVQFYKAADIDRKVYSAMRNNKRYQPKKETAIACCFGLGLSLEETEELLDSAGYSLSTSIRRDVIIRYCLLQHNYSIYDVNAILDAAGEKTLR